MTKCELQVLLTTYLPTSFWPRSYWMTPQLYMSSCLWLVCCTNLHHVFSTHVVINITCTECLFYSTLLSSQKALSQIEKNSNLLPAMLSGKDKMGMSVLGNWALFRSTNFRRLWHALNVVCDLKIGWLFSEGMKKVQKKHCCLFSDTWYFTSNTGQTYVAKVLRLKKKYVKVAMLSQNQFHPNVLCIECRLWSYDIEW